MCRDTAGVAFPLGRFIGVTGVSGSGKSPLVQEMLSKALHAELHSSKRHPGRHRRLTGVEQIDNVINIDHSPIGLMPMPTFSRCRSEEAIRVSESQPWVSRILGSLHDVGLGRSLLGQPVPTFRVVSRKG